MSITQYETELVETARIYCRIIESSDWEDGAWLNDVAALLPRLHAAITSLNNHCRRQAELSNVDLDARFDLFTQLRSRLGERDSYWMEYDLVDDNGTFKSGSLADDLTDIYCELKQGLMLLERTPRAAIDELRRSFAVHWGQHLVDAERHLYNLRVRGQLPASAPAGQ